MTSTTQVPDWLQQSNNNNGAAGPTPDDAEMGVNKNSNMTSIELDDGKTSNVATAANNNGTGTENTSFCKKCMKYTCMVISFCLFALFIGSSVVQDNDTGGSAIVYLLFYALHAIVAGAYLFSLFFCTTIMERIVKLLGGSMVVWSIVFVVISSIQYSKTDAEDNIIEEGGDNPNATKREEIAYEIGGAILGVISATYHLYMVHKK